MAAATSPRRAERHPAVALAGEADAGVLSDPHNSFFVHTFGQKEHADGLLRAIVPPALGRRLRWETLSREPASFVDGRLRWLHSDLLFSVRTLEEDGGEEVPVYLPVEHQSRPHPLMAYRVLRYVTRAWDEIDAHAGENVVTVYEQLIEQGRQKGLLQGLEKGLEKGRTEGLEEGRTEGRAAMLIELLAVKFGTVPAEVKKRIEKASSDDLTTWGRRVLTAATLDEVFTQAPAPRPARRGRPPRR